MDERCGDAAAALSKGPPARRRLARCGRSRATSPRASERQAARRSPSLAGRSRPLSARKRIGDRSGQASAYLVAALALLALGGIPTARAADDAASTPAAAAPAAEGAAETGLAAVYSDRLNGRKTANGERYNRNQLTAAHKTLPFGTHVKVTNTKNHRSVIVRINDRGPAQADRILDISPTAAKALGIRPTAMGEVSAVVVGQAPKRVARR